MALRGRGVYIKKDDIQQSEKTRVVIHRMAIFQGRLMFYASTLALELLISTVQQCVDLNNHSLFFSHDISNRVIEADVISGGAKLVIEDIVTQGGCTSNLGSRFPHYLREVIERRVLRII